MLPPPPLRDVIVTEVMVGVNLAILYLLKADSLDKDLECFVLNVFFIR